ncbi:hypothetical protein [Streptomyces sp. B5E4]|uniref:hypothetical protein n=1 Tax=Streptomyces sp. B5E4 TaxID=3153568 RepID=UPI00325EE80F
MFAVYVGAVAGFFQLLARLLFGVSNDEAKSVERQRRHDHAEYLKQKRREAKSAQRLQRERDRRER